MHGRSRFRVGFAASAVALAVLSSCITWEAPTTQAVTIPAGTSLHASSFLPGDIDGDGFEDLVGSVYVPGTPTTRATYVGIVLFSNGDGTFTQAAFPEGLRPEVVADLDGDGIDDVVATGPGSFGSTENLPSTLFFGGPADGPRPRGLSADDTGSLPAAQAWDVGDFDGDGDVDLVRFQTMFVYYPVADPWLNDGAASFTEALELRQIGGPTNAGPGWFLIYERDEVDIAQALAYVDPTDYPWAGAPADPVAWADIDGDGSDDWVVAEGGELRFYRWNGATNVAFPDYQDLAISGDLGSVELLDLDGDGLLDLTYTDDAGRHTYAGTGDGGFPYSSIGDHAPPGDPSGHRAAAWVDLDGDGLVDAVRASADRQSLVVRMNTSTPVG